ncbi:MAG TPA: hypothetical protein VGR22_00460 [Thermomicrobiales bacterium]|nr:hypothetical protein [Thermomicrobiales bacterium]
MRLLHSPTSNRWRWPVTLALLTLLYLVLRVTDLDQLVTVDEPFWLARSANFYRALWQGDLAYTFQHAHPGVTTMWAGMVGYWVAAPGYVDAFDTNLDNVFNIHQRLREMGLAALDVLIAARLAKIGLQAMLFLLSLVLLRRLFGVGITVVAGAIIALDPFLIAHDQLLQIDGLVTISSLAAALALADAVTRDRWDAAPWIVAGALAAIAWLTRITGLALIGVTGLVLLITVLMGRRGTLGARLRTATRYGTLWLTAALITTIALWPALWTGPERAVAFMRRYVAGAVAEGHEGPIYFMGDLHTGDPGVLFYPVSMLWRLSVASSIGLVLAAVSLAVPSIRRALPARLLRAIGILLLFAVLYLVGMALGAKKFDRYVLPVHAVLDVIAAIGIVATLRWALPRRRSIARVAMPIVLIALLLAQTLVTLGHRPYYLVAYNPLLGGAEAAEDVVRMGYGEGTDAAARWIIEDSGVRPGQEIDDPPVVHISGAPAPLHYLLPPPFMVDPGGFRTAEDWEVTDYYVVSIQQRRVREWPPNQYGPTIAYLQRFEPAHTVWIEGVRYADVWDLSEIPSPPWLTGPASCEWQFEPWLQLENVVIDGEIIALWFQTLTAVDLPGRVVVTVDLVPRTLNTPAVDQTWEATFEPRPRRGLVTDVMLEIPPLAAEATGDYLLEITVHDGETGESLPAYPPNSSISHPAAVIGSRCASGVPDANPANVPSA